MPGTGESLSFTLCARQIMAKQHMGIEEKEENLSIIINKHGVDTDIQVDYNNINQSVNIVGVWH